MDPPAVLSAERRMRSRAATAGIMSAAHQGLTLVHFLAQRKRILWDRGAIRGCFGGVYKVLEGIKEY